MWQCSLEHPCVKLLSLAGLGPLELEAPLSLQSGGWASALFTLPLPRPDCSWAPCFILWSPRALPLCQHEVHSYDTHPTTPANPQQAQTSELGQTHHPWFYACAATSPKGKHQTSCLPVLLLPSPQSSAGLPLGTLAVLPGHSPLQHQHTKCSKCSK